MDTSQISRKGRLNQIYFDLIVFFGLLLLTLIIRLALENSRGFDEGLFALISKMVAQGDKIYVDFWVDKPPLMFMINAVIFRVFGDSLNTVIVLYSLITAFCGFMASKISFLISPKRIIAIMSGVFFIVFTSLPLSELQWIMGETYLIALGLVGLYFLIKTTQSQNRIYSFLSGLFAFSTFWIRPTAITFLIPYVVFVVYMRKKVQVKYIVLGMLVSFVAVILYLYFYSDLHNFLYQVYIDRITYLTKNTASYSGKISWFERYLLSSLPLWGLSIISLFSKDFKERAWGNFLYFWTAMVVSFYLVLDFAPGFAHEHSETLGPMSILAAIGFGYLIGQEKIRRKVILITIFVVTLAVSVYANTTLGDFRTKDLEFLSSVGKSLAQSQSNNSFFVLETQIPKITPMLYFKNSTPKINFERITFAIQPNQLADFELLAILDQFKLNQPKAAVVIGGEPPKYPEFNNISELYKYIYAHYRVSSSKLPIYQPYSNRPLKFKTALLESAFGQNNIKLQEIPVENIVGVESLVSADIAKVKYADISDFTINFRLSDITDLEDKSLEIPVYGNARDSYIDIDLVDTNNNFARYRMRYHQGWQTDRLIINSNSFWQASNLPVSLKRIKEIHLIFPEQSSDIQVKNLSIYAAPGSI